MQGFRDLAGGQCGDPSALSQLSSGVTSMPTVLADARAYDSRRATGGAPSAGAMLASTARTQAGTHEAMRMAMEMSSEFEERSKTRGPMMAGAPPSVMPAAVMHGRVAPARVMATGGMSMPYAMPMQMPMPMYPPGLMQPMTMMRPPPPTQMHATPLTAVAVSSAAKTEDGISTNGTSEMKSDKEVTSELADLKPTKAEKAAIDDVLISTSADSDLQGSKFFDLLRQVTEQETAVEESKLDGELAAALSSEDMAARWREQFADWNPVDGMDWSNYMKQIDGSSAASASAADAVSKDPVYVFAAVSEGKRDMAGDEQVMDERDWFAEGLRLMNEGNLNEAIEAFETVVRREEAHSEAWRYLGVCHADNESEKQAIAAFLKCQELDPFDLDALLQLGVSYTNEIEQFRALNYLKQWISSHPDYGTIIADAEAKAGATEEGLMMLGGWSGLRGEQTRVRDMFISALSINERDVDLHIVLGVLYNLTSEYAKGEFHFKKALQIKPEDASLWNKLGATQANGGKCAEAIKAYSRALELKPNYVRALSNLGISFANQDMHVKACQSYLASLKRNPSADAVWDHLSMSLIHLGRGDLVELVEKRDVSLFAKHFDF